MTRKYLYVARNRRQHTTVEGIAKSGEISPKGLVAHTEDWDGRRSATSLPSSMRYIKDADGIRKMTFREMVDRGYFIVGKGPAGMKGTR